MGKVHYTQCPVCASTECREVLKAKDYTVSGELFSIWQCKDCSLRFTQDVPDTDSISPYYQAESYISHTDTKKGLINRLYHAVRQRTLRHKRKLVEKMTRLNTGHLLDLGSGTGAFANEMQQHQWKVTGVEPDANARNTAKQRYGLTVSSPDDFWALPAATVDVVTMWHVLEHVHRLQEYMQQLKKILKPGGCILIAVPNYTAREAKVYGEYWAAYDVPRHLYHFSPDSMEMLVHKNGLQLKSYRPMWYDSFYIPYS